MSASFWLRTGAIWGFLAVMMGSFGAHGLQGRFESLGSVPGGLPTQRLQANFQTATQYQMYCALAILAVGLMAHAGRSGTALDVAGWLFLAGSLVFSGSLYILCVTGEARLGMITPIGGVATLAGWIALAVAAGAASKPTSGELGTP
jgi:uncharacterized membrane protein YgdD (TMEM256/DUF423 family)